MTARFVKHAEGDGGALRGRLGARRRGRRRREAGPADAELSLVGRPAPRLDGKLARRARALHGRRPARRACSTRRFSARPSRTGACERSTSTPHVRRDGVRAVIGPESELSLTDAKPHPRVRAGVCRPADRCRRGGHAGGGAAGRAGARARRRGAPPRDRPAGGRQRAALHDRADRRRARRRRGGARGRRGDRRARARDARPAADRARAARRRRLLGRRPDHGLGLDAGDVLRAARSSRAPSGCARTTSASASTSSAAASAPSREPASRRSPRRSWRGSRAGPSGSSTTGTRSSSTAAAAARRKQTIRLGATKDGTLTAIEADAVVAMGQGGWIFPVAQPGPHALPLRGRARAHVPRQDEPARPERVPRPGRDGGRHGLRAGDGRARARARDRPARAAPPQPRRRRPGQRAAVHEQAAARLLRPRRRARRLGRAATSSASRRPTGSCAGWAAPRRSGGAAAGRPRTRPSASTPTVTRSSSPGIQDIGTGTLTGAQIVAAEELGLPARQRSRRRRGHGPQRLRPGRGRLDDDAVGDARRALGGGEGAEDAPAARERRLRDRARATSRCATGGSARATAPSTPR